MTKNHFIALEGPIGAGKTTLASIFSKQTGWNLILEEFDDNEFLSDFYKDRLRWSLPMQASFLLSRCEQMQKAFIDHERPTIADYSYAKDAIFAKMLLREPREWRLYKKIWSNVTLKTCTPNAIIYVDAPNDILINRIRKRGRPYEQGIDGHYLDELRSAYKADLLDRAEFRTFRIDTSKIDIDSPDNAKQFCERVLDYASQVEP